MKFKIGDKIVVNENTSSQEDVGYQGIVIELPKNSYKMYGIKCTHNSRILFYWEDSLTLLKDIFLPEKNLTENPLVLFLDDGKSPK